MAKFLFIGSFAPFHIGHLDILNQMITMFGKENILLYKGINPNKVNENDRDTYIQKHIEECSNVSQRLPVLMNMSTKCTATLIADLEKDLGEKVILVRGIRNSVDLEHENTQMKFIHQLNPNVVGLYIQSEVKYNYISSTAIRNMLESGIKELQKQAIGYII